MRIIMPGIGIFLEIRYGSVPFLLTYISVNFRINFFWSMLLLVLIGLKRLPEIGLLYILQCRA